MKKIVRLTESDLIKLVKKVINEQRDCPDLVKINPYDYQKTYDSVYMKGKGIFSLGWKQTPNNMDSWRKVFAEGNVVYQTKLNVNDSLEVLKKCQPKNSNLKIETVSFQKGNEFITYIGIRPEQSSSLEKYSNFKL